MVPSNRTFTILDNDIKIFKPKNTFIKQSNFSNNLIVKILFKFESILTYLYLPFGIRCVICARKI